MPQQTLPLSTLPHLILPRLILPEEAKFAWLQKALELVYPDARDRRAWGAFTAASARLAQSHLPSRIQEQLNEFFSPDGADALLI